MFTKFGSIFRFIYKKSRASNFSFTFLDEMR